MTFCCSSVCTAPLDARMPQALFGGTLKRVTEMSVRLVHFAFRKLSALVIDSINDWMCFILSPLPQTSVLCKSAVHAGAASDSLGGRVTVTRERSLKLYESTFANGILSQMCVFCYCYCTQKTINLIVLCKCSDLSTSFDRGSLSEKKLLFTQGTSKSPFSTPNILFTFLLWCF